MPKREDSCVDAIVSCERLIGLREAKGYFSNLRELPNVDVKHKIPIGFVVLTAEKVDQGRRVGFGHGLGPGRGKLEPVVRPACRG